MEKLPDARKTILLSPSNALRRAARWFTASGIQEPAGGVARYYRSDLECNQRVSTEITGYSVSALCWFHRRLGDAQYLDAATRAGRFLCRQAWDASANTFPFEHSVNGDVLEPLAYFFDCGIIVRGLLACWRASGDAEFLAAAERCGRSMAADFLFADTIHPILTLPPKTPVEYGATWSRRPGCYQLKSALAWLELSEATGDGAFAEYYEAALAMAMRGHGSFLPGDDDCEKVMDRLHAFCYFLEALLPVTDRPACRMALEEGISRVAALLRQIAPLFARSDVYAQLLRVRLLAAAAGAVELNRPEAESEAAAMKEFQLSSPDRRLDGGFSFGRRSGTMAPYVNPVSTAFCAQSLDFWSLSVSMPEKPVSLPDWRVLI